MCAPVSPMDFLGRDAAGLLVAMLFSNVKN